MSLQKKKIEMAAAGAEITRIVGQNTAFGVTLVTEALPSTIVRTTGSELESFHLMKGDDQQPLVIKMSADAATKLPRGGFRLKLLGDSKRSDLEKLKEVLKASGYLWSPSKKGLLLKLNNAETDPLKSYMLIDAESRCTLFVEEGYGEREISFHVLDPSVRDEDILRIVLERATDDVKRPWLAFDYATSLGAYARGERLMDRGVSDCGASAFVPRTVDDLKDFARSALGVDTCASFAYVWKVAHLLATYHKAVREVMIATLHAYEHSSFIQEKMYEAINQKVFIFIDPLGYRSENEEPERPTALEQAETFRRTFQRWSGSYTGKTVTTETQSRLAIRYTATLQIAMGECVTFERMKAKKLLDEAKARKNALQTESRQKEKLTATASKVAEEKAKVAATAEEGRKAARKKLRESLFLANVNAQNELQHAQRKLSSLEDAAKKSKQNMTEFTAQNALDDAEATRYREADSYTNGSDADAELTLKNAADALALEVVAKRLKDRDAAYLLPTFASAEYCASYDEYCQKPVAQVVFLDKDATASMKSASDNATSDEASNLVNIHSIVMNKRYTPLRFRFGVVDGPESAIQLGLNDASVYYERGFLNDVILIPLEYREGMQRSAFDKLGLLSAWSPPNSMMSDSPTNAASEALKYTLLTHSLADEEKLAALEAILLGPNIFQPHEVGGLDTMDFCGNGYLKDNFYEQIVKLERYKAIFSLPSKLFTREFDHASDTRASIFWTENLFSFLCDLCPIINNAYDEFPASLRNTFPKPVRAVPVNCKNDGKACSDIFDTIAPLVTYFFSPQFLLDSHVDLAPKLDALQRKLNKQRYEFQQTLNESALAALSLTQPINQGDHDQLPLHPLIACNAQRQPHVQLADVEKNTLFVSHVDEQHRIVPLGMTNDGVGRLIGTSQHAKAIVLIHAGKDKKELVFGFEVDRGDWWGVYDGQGRFRFMHAIHPLNDIYVKQLEMDELDIPPRNKRQKTAVTYYKNSPAQDAVYLRGNEHRFRLTINWRFGAAVYYPALVDCYIDKFDEGFVTSVIEALERFRSAFVLPPVDQQPPEELSLFCKEPSEENFVIYLQRMMMNHDERLDFPPITLDGKACIMYAITDHQFLKELVHQVYTRELVEIIVLD